MGKLVACIHVMDTCKCLETSVSILFGITFFLMIGSSLPCKKFPWNQHNFLQEKIYLHVQKSLLLVSLEVPPVWGILASWKEQ